jgi:hypothetical protein
MFFFHPRLAIVGMGLENGAYIGGKEKPAAADSTKETVGSLVSPALENQSQPWPGSIGDAETAEVRAVTLQVSH